VSGAIAGFQSYNFVPSKLTFGQNISIRPFGENVGVLASFSGPFSSSPWLQAGTGFVGFCFNGGAGQQYGWARITMDGAPANKFTLVDYAFADLGQRIRAGQTGVSDSGGSLGLLAIGCAGLLAWRACRLKAAQSGV
jgi:hypothetical protein